MKYLYVFFLFSLLTPFISYSQGCPNGDFEMGDFSNWNADRTCNFGGLPMGLGLDNGDRLLDDGSGGSSPCCTENTGLGNSLLNCQHSHSIQSSGNNDATLLSNTYLNPYTLPVVPLTGGNFSARLGNAMSGYAVERISRTVTVPPSKIIFFKYALVMQQSHSNNDGSIDGTEVFFLARALDASNQEIARFVQVGNPNNSFVQQVCRDNQWCRDNNCPQDSRRCSPFYYHDWDCVALDLTDYVGSTVTLEFINSDCSLSAHYGYTYIDDVCIECDTTKEEPTVNITAITDTCISLNSLIQGNFTLPVQGAYTGQFISLDLLIYQNRSQVTSVNVNSFVTGTNFSIPLNPIYFNGLTGECFDIFVQGTFTLTNPYSGQTQTLVEQSAPLALGYGVATGRNNDVCICAVECCENVYITPIGSNVQIFPNLSSSPPSTLFYVDMNFIAGPNLITKVSTFIEDFHITYNHEDCSNCFNPPINWGSTAITDPAANNGMWDVLTNTGLVNPYPYFANPEVNIREVVWSDLADPRDFTSGAPIRWYLFLPTITEIPCCVNNIELCVTFTITDIDCNVCEESFCFPLSYDANGFAKESERKNSIIPFGLEKMETPQNRKLEKTEIEELEKTFKIKIESKKE